MLPFYYTESNVVIILSNYVFFYHYLMLANQNSIDHDYGNVKEPSIGEVDLFTLFFGFLFYFLFQV